MVKQKYGYKTLPLWETIDSFGIQSSSSWYRSMPCRHSDEDKIYNNDNIPSYRSMSIVPIS